MSKVRTIGVVVLAVLAVIVLLQNLAPVEARFLFFVVRAPGALMMTATLAIGFGLGMLVALSLRRAQRAPDASTTRR